MGFGVDRRARSPKAKGGLRALLGRAPDAREVGDRLVRIARRMLGDAVLDATARRLTLQLHPDAAPVRIIVAPDGDLEVSGETGSIGPAYHAHVVATVERLLEEIDFIWDTDEPEPRGAMTRWFAGELARGATRIAMPAELHFKLDAAVQTAMGPRDRAWCDAVIADPSRAADAFAWWDAGPGRRERSAALLAMWLAVPWREPLDREERDLMKRVDHALREAREAAPTLELPYAEWAEIVENLGGEPEQIAELRGRANGKAPSIGYRRHSLELEIDAWRLVLPGSFAGGFEDDRYWATDGDRVVELTMITTDGTQDSQALLDVAPEQHPVIERVTGDARRGRAEAYTDGDVHVVHGLMAATPDVAILTCKSANPDTTWAFTAWRSLSRRPDVG